MNELKYNIILVPVEYGNPYDCQLIRSNVKHMDIKRAFKIGCSKIKYPIEKEFISCNGYMDAGLLNEVINLGCSKEHISDLIKQFNSIKKNNAKDLALDDRFYGFQVDVTPKEVIHIYMFIAQLGNKKIKYELIPSHYYIFVPYIGD